MAGYGIIGGKNTRTVQEQLNKSTEIKIDTTWEFVDDLIKELIKTPTQIIDDLESILVIDTGLKNTHNTNKAVEEFLGLQDLMESKGLMHVKLYFITKNNNIYDKLKGNINGMEGMHYKNVEMFYVEGNLSIPYIIGILLGKMDGKGIQSSKSKTITQIERLTLEKQALVDDASRVSRESLEYGKKEPVIEINQEEILGSKKQQEMIKKEEQEIRKLEREIESLKKKKQKNQPKRLQKLQEESIRVKENELQSRMTEIQGKKIELVIDLPVEQENFTNDVLSKNETPEKEIKETNPRIDLEKEKVSDINTYKSLEGLDEKERKETLNNNINILTAREKGVPSVSDLRILYKQLSSQDSDTIEQKIRSDKGVISFIGQRGTGVSGLLAQTADIYAMLGKKVLIIDLDILLRSQTMYFPTYSDSVAIHKGVSNSLIKMTQTTNIKDNAVPVTSRIDMLSTEKTNEIINEGFHSTIVNIFEELIDNARKEYDIVLIDLPIDYLNYYVRHIDKIDKNVFVLQNSFYQVEDFFSIKLQSLIQSNDIFSISLFNKSSIVLNKYRKDFRDLDGYQMNKNKVKELLLKAGSPYDSIPIIAEVPEYKDWEEQYSRKVRYIWEDDLALELYRRIVSKIL